MVGVAVAVGVGVMVGVAVAVGVSVAVAVWVGVALAAVVALAIGIGVAVAVGVEVEGSTISTAPFVVLPGMDPLPSGAPKLGTGSAANSSDVMPSVQAALVVAVNVRVSNGFSVAAKGVGVAANAKSKTSSSPLLSVGSAVKDRI